MRARPTIAATGVAAALALAGCGITNPYAASTTAPAKADTATAAATTTADPTPVHERGGTIPAAAANSQDRPATAAGQTPQSAITRFVSRYVNWTSHTVAANQRQLAAISVDAARAQALQAAATYRSDSVLQSSQVTNTGQILSISRGEGSAAGDWVVVTRETTNGSGGYQGLPAQDHVYLAQLIHTTTGWALSSWTPES